MAAANNRTLKELATPNLDQKPLCIQYPNLEVAFELKSGKFNACRMQQLNYSYFSKDKL